MFNGFNFKNSGIYITGDGIVGYCLLSRIELHNPREFDDNLSEIYSFDGKEGDYSYNFSEDLKNMSNINVQKTYLLNKLSDKEFIKGIKRNTTSNNLELCEIDDADYGIICSDYCTLKEEKVEETYREEIREYNLYLKGQEYFAIKMSFIGEEMERYEYLYGENPEDSGIFNMMGKPINEKSIKTFDLDSIDIEYLIEEGIFLDNEDFFNFCLDNLKNEQIIGGIRDFYIDNKKETLNKEFFLIEFFDYLKALPVEERKLSEGLDLIINYLLNKASKIYELYKYY